jgi:hypothetical protein
VPPISRLSDLYLPTEAMFSRSRRNDDYVRSPFFKARSQRRNSWRFHARQVASNKSRQKVVNLGRIKQIGRLARISNEKRARVLEST